MSIIKANIDNINDLPNICSDVNIIINVENIIKTITNFKAKKKLIVELLNKNLMKLKHQNEDKFTPRMIKQ
jgi:hypothetical protein